MIFRGTYDEYNWKVLRERWCNLRSQLHGDVIPPEAVRTEDADWEAFNEIAKAVPNFSPSGSEP